MEVTNKDLEKVIDLYFKEQYAIYKNRYKSFHQFIDEIIYKELKNNSNIIHENFTKDKIYRYKFVFDDISLRPPLIENEDRFMWPEDARMKHLTYASKLIATVKQVQETIDINTGEKSVRVVGDIEREVPIAKIPIMVRSKFCTLNIKKDEKNTECKYDPGGYFIVNGSEKVVLSLERICENKQLVFTKKDNTYDDGLMYYVDIHSKGREINGYPQKLTIKMKKDNSIVAVISQLAEVPIFILFRALGLVSDSDITRYISYDISDTEMINLVRFSMDSAVPDPSKPESDANKKIKTQKEALDFLITKIRQSKRYSDTSLEVQYEQKRKHLNRILTKNLLPHMGDNHTNKAFYIGLAVNKLLATFLGRREVDARDSYGNKRVDEVGVLLGQLFKQHYNKMLNDCSRHFRRKNNDDVNPINVINQIKPNTIEQGLKSGLMTGIWGASRSKKGVSQALQRLTYLQTISYFRRVITPSVDPSTNKQTSIRHVRNIQFGFICGVETPEGQSIGLVKNLSMMCNITLMLTSQIYIIKNILRGKLISLTDVPPEMYQKMVKVFLNGEWLGLSEEPVRLVEFLKNKKRNGDIESTVSIILNIANKEINIYCDGGRMYRPLLKVKDNKLVITKKIIDEIGDGPDQINKWSQLLLKYPDIIEYVDVEESETLMIAMYADDVRKQWKMMNTVIKSPNKQGNPINRYNSVYTRLTHCEFHPSMQLGMVSSNIPFCEHNQSPRNIYNFSQARQAMGLYATNHRLRMDISYLLYHPQVPLVITKAMRYLNTIELPAGENAIVAIASYSGYNQEDSVIMSQSAIDRGLFNSTSLKKYHELIQKNPSTSQDDIFVKPDRNKVSGMKDGNYDKLNDRGFVPEETQVVKGDVIIGKVSPILPTATSSKIYRDSSKMYKGNVPGVVDKVHTGIYNSEGYEMYNMRIRSQRIPKIGDKFSCYSPDHDILTSEGWIKIVELTLKHKVATLVDGDTLEYHYPTAIQEYDYKGQMYKVESNQVNLMVTPNHRMYVKPAYKGAPYRVELAEDIYGKVRHYKKNVGNYVPENPMVTFTLPAFDEYEEKELDLNAWLVFFGIWIAEGCTLRSYGVSFATHKPRVKKALEKCCAKLGFEIRKHKDKVDDTVRNAWVIADKQLVAYFRPLSVGAVNKSLPDWAWNLNPKQCNFLIDGMLLGDGHTMKNGTRRYDTSSKQLADDLQRLCLHAGWSTNIAVKYEAGHESYCESRDEIFKSTTDAYRMSIITKQNNPKVNKNATKGKQLDSWVDYNGKVYCCTVDSGIVYVRRNKMPIWSGNSRHGQKGTIGITLPNTDMPFTKDGIQPDIIVNPNAIPSRMTIGQLLECLTGKVGAILGHLTDGTPFNNVDIEEVKDILEGLGYNREGYETLTCGMTGKRMKAEIFIGPTFYYRLKHLVDDKIHSRAMGPRQILTRQPPEGRSRDGGLRFGEMERDVMCSYGMAQFLKERLVDTSDIYHVWVCDTCGLFASKMINKNIYVCNACRNYTNTTKISIPYAFKLLLQELQAISIAARIKVKKDEFVDSV